MRYSKFILTGLLLIIAFYMAFGIAPENKKKSPAIASSSPGMDLIFGLKGGVNFSLISPTRRFSVIQGMNGSSVAVPEKDYALFYENTGYQYGFIGLYKINKSLSISIEPTFSSYTIKYTTGNSWSDNINRIEITTDFNTKLKYFEIPLILRYEINTGEIRPFIAAGFFYGLQTGAPAHAKSTTVQFVNDVEIPLDNSESAGDVSGNYINTRLAVFPGAGLLYELGFMSIFAEVDYIIGLHNVVNESARYSNQQSVGGYYDVPDNLRFDNLVFNMGVLFNITSRQKGSAIECPTFIRKR